MLDMASYKNISHRCQDDSKETENQELSRPSSIKLQSFEDLVFPKLSRFWKTKKILQRLSRAGGYLATDQPTGRSIYQSKLLTQSYFTNDSKLNYWVINISE